MASPQPCGPCGMAGFHGPSAPRHPLRKSVRCRPFGATAVQSADPNRRFLDWIKGMRRLTFFSRKRGKGKVNVNGDV